ncbi:MAG: hypothetical protein Q7J73_00245 [Dehalococcoidales bacterium]|nr:hypothetical protein [Dehalococcoidales bacterium]
MSDFETLTGKQVRDLGDKIGGAERAKRFMSGELVLAERSAQAAVASGDNGGISPYVSTPLLNVEVFIADWREFYRQVHSMRVNPSSLKRLPPVTSGFNWGVWVPKGMMPQRAYEMGAAMYPSWKWCGDRSLDDVVDFTKEARNASARQYLTWCEDSVEPSSKLTNLSAIKIAERQINTLTLTEMELLHQWFYWKSSGKHLDVKNISLCPASRYFDGFVPGVRWHGSLSGLDVYGCDPDNSDDDLRSRQAVS